MNSDPLQSSKQNQRVCSLLGISCFVILCFFWGGYWLVSTLEQESIREHYTVLDAIARMKTDQLLAWRYERLADARMNSSGLIKTITNEWLRTGNPEELKNVADRLETFRENEGYHNMILADTRGKILVSLIAKTELFDPSENGPRQHELLEQDEKALLSQVLASGQPTLGDFYYCHTCNRIHINVAAPVVNKDNTTIAVLFLVSNPEISVYPLLQTWPVSQGHIQTTAEDPFLSFPGPSFIAEPLIWPGANADAHGTSLLVRKEKENVLFLSPLQYPPTPAFSLRLSLTNMENPAVRAVRGESGMTRGRDCNGENVLADMRPIPGTAWSMVTKIDADGLLSKARFQGFGILFLLAMTMSTTAALVRLATVSRQKALSEALLQAEHERSQTKEEIRATLYGIGAGVIATDADGLVTRLNPEAEKMCGWTEQEALDQPLASVYCVINEETSESVKLPIEQVLAEGVIVEVSNHVLLVARDGQCRPVTDSWSPIYNETGDINGVVLVFRDQTRKKAMEMAQIESGKRYSNLVENVNDFIWETDPEHRFTFVNSRVTAMLGYCPEEIIGRPWDTFLCAEEATADDSALSRAYFQPYSMSCQTWISKDGGKVIFESNASATFDQQGQFLGYQGISRDITDRRLAEAEQEKLQGQLHQAQKMDTIGRLAGGVAHDFNNMLTVICNYAEMSLEEIGADHPLRKRLAAIHQAALHSADLTRQLLAFARKQIIAPRIIDINETIEGTLKMLQRLIGENITLTWKPGSDTWPVKMDPTQVSQILANLAVNARDAIVATGHLIITTDNLVIDQVYTASRLDFSPGDYVCVTVSDDGVGMNSDILANIFEPFFTTKGENQGTGLGLATVHGIVYQNGGFVNVYSEPGQGTTFRIYFPRMDTAAEDSLSPQVGDAVRGYETILIVEDEIAILELSTIILQSKGYTVLVADTPNAALEIVRTQAGSIHLVITDVIMPQMNGRDLMQRIAQLQPGIKCLFMSGYTADIIARQGILESGLQFIEKPFSVIGLCSKVREVLDQG